MSRIGLKPITLSPALTVQVEGNRLRVKGPKGELQAVIPPGILVSLDPETIHITRQNNALQTKAFHGLLRSLTQNMVTGVTFGYQKKLELVGTGYRVKPQGNNLVLSVGFSHPIEFPAPAGITLTIETDTLIAISGIDKQLVGEVAAKIRALRPPEPYKGKGIRYQGEIIRRKAGKAAKVGTAA